MTNHLISEKIVSWDFAPPFDFTAQFLASRARRRGDLPAGKAGQTIALASKKSGSPVWCPLFENARTFFERNWRSAPPPLANARHPAKKFSSHFLICALPIFSSKRKRKLFCWVLLWTSRAAGLRFSGRRAKIFLPSNSPPIFARLFIRLAKFGRGRKSFLTLSKNFSTIIVV